MPIKTLHITNAWHETSGGISTFYRALLEEANRRDHLLRLAVPGPRDRVEHVGPWGRIYHIKAPVAPFNSSYRILYPHLFLRRSGALRQILRDERPDLVEVCDKYCQPFLAGCLRIQAFSEFDFRPATVGLSCERMDENVEHYLGIGRAGALFARWYMKWIYFPMFDNHIAVSDHAAGELRAASRGHKVRRGVWTCPMGVDTGAFHPSRRTPRMRQCLLEKAGAAGDSLLLLYAGRLAPEKNVHLLIDVLEALQRQSNDVRLLVAGDGILQRELKDSAMRRTPGRVTFLGFQDRAHLADLYAGADIFVHPNPREPFGIAPLEAMAAGLPLVAPAAGGVLTYANESNAWLAAPEAESFAEAIRAVASDPLDRAFRCASARRTAEDYNWPSIASRYLTLYEDICLRPESVRIRPSFYSTAGDWFGREIDPACAETTPAENV